MKSRVVIGVDFDNTLVSYDDLIYRVALQRRLIRADLPKRKRVIRDSIRQSSGDDAWHGVQTLVYGERMEEAKLICGVQGFFILCHQQRIPVFIVSHKTEWIEAEEKRVNLWMTAMRWMTQQRFFAREGLGLSQSDVYFEPTRRDKVERIHQLGCTHFIDDLEETFHEVAFPAEVKQLLYAAGERVSTLPHAKVFATWEEISDYFFRFRD